MPEQSTKCGASANSSIMNSWLSSWARFPAEGRDYLTDRNGRHGASCCAADMVKSLAGGVGCLLIVVIVCGRADQRIAVNRRGYKNALAVFARKLEDGLVDQTAGCFVEQAVFAAAPG